jgi:hypothetical protein
MSLNQDYSVASSVHKRNDEEIGSKYHTDKIGRYYRCSGVEIFSALMLRTVLFN